MNQKGVKCGHSISQCGHSVSVDTHSVSVDIQSVWTLSQCGHSVSQYGHSFTVYCLTRACSKLHTVLPGPAENCSLTHCLTWACRKLQSYTLSYQGLQKTAQSYTWSYQGLQKTALCLTLCLTRACSWVWSLRQWCCVRWGWSGRNFRKDWTLLPKGDDQNLDQPHQV